MTRVTQLAQQTLTLNNLLNAQARLQEAEIQIATGRKSQDYAGISRDASRLVSLESQRIRLERFVSNNAIIESRLQLMDTSITTIFETMSQLRTLLIQGLDSSSSGDTPIAEVAQNLLDEVAGQLNTKDNGRFIFSGARTNTQAVRSPVPDPASFGTPDSSYYDGDSLQLTARIDETVTVTYGITADRQAFQDAIGALKGAIEGDATNNTTLLRTSLALAISAIDTLASYRAEIGSDLETIGRANLRNGDLLLFIDQRIGDIENVDIPAAVAQLAIEQTILQASYLTLARVSSLSLVDFLR